MVMTTSALAQATSIDIPTTPPAAPNFSRTLSTTSNPVTECPAFIKFCAIGKPILPSPIKPICVMPCPPPSAPSCAPGNPPLHIRYQPLGADTVHHGTSIGPERAHRRHITRDLAGVAHRLR